MTKIEKAIYDVELHLESLRNKKLTLNEKINVLEEVLDMLKCIEKDNSISQYINPELDLYDKIISK